MTFDDAIRVLLRGTTGVNASEVYRTMRVRHEATLVFAAGGTIPDRVRDQIALFVWQRLNAHCLLCETDEDGMPIPAAAALKPPRKMPRTWSRRPKPPAAS